MNPKPIIQKSIAVLLLLLFAVSIAPKAYFHDLVADHKDFSACNQFHKSTVLHTQGYNCHFDDLVATGPFVLLTDPIAVLAKYYFFDKQESFYISHLESFFQQKESRGPPSV